MAAKSTIYNGKEGRLFRSIIRPSLIGNIGRVEPRMAARMADAIEDWLKDVVKQTLNDTKLKDKRGEVAKQLYAGIRTTGGYSLNSLRGRLDVYPWLKAQEFGAIILPENSEYLTIPLPAALRADGSPIFRSARSWNRYGSFVWENKKTGKKLIVRKNAGSQKLIFLYVLVDKVEVKAKLGFNRHAIDMLPQLMSAWGAIYVQEAYLAGITELWGARK